MNKTNEEMLNGFIEKFFIQRVNGGVPIPPENCYPKEELQKQTEMVAYLNTALTTKDTELAEAVKAERERTRKVLLRCLDMDNFNLRAKVETLVTSLIGQSNKTGCSHHQAMKESGAVGLDQDGKCIDCGEQVLETDTKLWGGEGGFN